MEHFFGSDAAKVQAKQINLFLTPGKSTFL